MANACIEYHYEGRQFTGLRHPTAKSTVGYVLDCFAALPGVAEDRIDLRLWRDQSKEGKRLDSDTWVLAIREAHFYGVSVHLLPPTEGTHTSASSALSTIPEMPSVDGSLQTPVTIKVLRDRSFITPACGLPFFGIDADLATNSTNPHYPVRQQFPALPAFTLSCRGGEVEFKGLKKLAAQFNWTALEEIVLVMHDDVVRASTSK